MTVRSDLELIVDKNGKPLPQFFNAATGKMELYESDVENFPATQDVNVSNAVNTNLVGAVSDNMLSELKKISGSFGAEDLWDTPGNQKLVEGDKDAGFFGFVTAADFINGDDLAVAIGLSTGVSQFSDTPWLKYMWKGKVCFTPLKDYPK